LRFAHYITPALTPFPHFRGRRDPSSTVEKEKSAGTSTASDTRFSKEESRKGEFFDALNADAEEEGRKELC